MKRIFFVEDDPGLMKGLVFALEKQGYEVVCARTLHEAERCWDENIVLLNQGKQQKRPRKVNCVPFGRLLAQSYHRFKEWL